MTTLTWRDVAAPDFRGVQDGYRNFSDMLNGAFEAASKGITKFDNAQTDRVNTAVLADIAGAHNIDEANALMQSLAFRPDASRLRADTIKLAMGRPTDLVKEAEAKSDLDWTNLGRDWARTSHDEMEAARPAIAALAEARQSGDAGKIAAVQQLYGAELGKIPVDKIMSTYTDLQGLESKSLDIRGTRTNQDNSAQDREEARLAEIANGMLRESGIDQTDWNRNFGSIRQKLIDQYGPMQGAFIAEKARRILFNDPTAVIASAAGGGGGGDVSGIVGSPDDVSAVVAAAQQLGTTPEDLATVISYETGGKFDPNIMGGKGNNYMGLIQFGPEERAKYGVKPGMTFQQQMGAVTNYLKDRGFRPGMGLMDLYSTINAGAPGKYDASDGNGTVRSHVQAMQAHRANATSFLGGKVGGAIAQGAQDFAGQLGPQYNRSQDPAQITARGIVEAMGSDADPRTVARNLTGKEGQLAGANVGNVAGVIKQISEQYKISPAAAGVILTKSVDADKNWWQRAGDKISGLWGGGDGLSEHIDWKQVEELGNLAGNRDALMRQATASKVNDLTTSSVASAAAADLAAQQAAARRLSVAAQNGRGTNMDFALAQAAGATGTHAEALANAGAVTKSGSRQPPAPPKTNVKNVPEQQKRAAPAKKPQDSRPTAHDINVSLAEVRRAADASNKLSGMTAPGFKQMQARGDYRRAVNASVDLAIASGLAPFKKLPNESNTLYRERIRNMLVHK